MLSIIIPTYSRPEQLRRAIESINGGGKNDIEVVVVDDDPAMSAANVVAAYPSVRYVAKRGVDRGLSRSRNIGIEFARHEFLVFLDDDDYLLDGSLELLLSSIDPQIDFYFGDFIYEKSGGAEHRSLQHISYDHLLVCNQIPVGAYMIRKGAIKHLFDVLMKSHEDWLFLLSNINWARSRYINRPLAVIDKTASVVDSMQGRRRIFFWMEFVGIYAKFPAPSLALERKQMLSTLGIDLPIELLRSSDCF
jgi:glycosyltransferase involved in cell wall biosynthesis